MNASPALIDFLKGWESCNLTPYLDAGDRWTVGWGHLLPASDMSGPITQDAADQMLAVDVAGVCRGLDMYVSSDPSQQQCDALISFAYNEGVRATANSTLLLHVNASEWADAAYQFPKWIYVHDAKTGVLIASAGLLKRRLAEQAIFSNGDYSGRP